MLHTPMFCRPRRRSSMLYRRRPARLHLARPIAGVSTAVEPRNSTRPCTSRRPRWRSCSALGGQRRTDGQAPHSAILWCSSKSARCRAAASNLAVATACVALKLSLTLKTSARDASRTLEHTTGLTASSRRRMCQRQLTLMLDGLRGPPNASPAPGFSCVGYIHAQVCNEVLGHVSQNLIFSWPNGTLCGFAKTLFKRACP